MKLKKNTINKKYKIGAKAERRRSMAMEQRVNWIASTAKMGSDWMRMHSVIPMKFSPSVATTRKGKCDEVWNTLRSVFSGI
jgi:hypothetical protein